MNNILTEAFKAFDLLDEEVFPATSKGEEKLKKFIDGDKTDEIETIIDPDAETMEEVKESYIGDVILNCPVCQSKFYRDPKDVIIDEEKELANVEESCPYCQTPGGFEIVGEVAEFSDHKDENEEIEDEEEEEIEVEESFSRKPLKEYKNLGGDLAEYQKWVDYDMKYNRGKISEKTKRELNKAGLEVVKDDHGDYEVIAKSRKKLGEAFQYPVARYLTSHIDELGDMISPEDARAKTLKVLEKGKEEAPEKEKKQFEDAIVKIRTTNKHGVLSMITTFLTQNRVNEAVEENDNNSLIDSIYSFLKEIDKDSDITEPLPSKKKLTQLLDKKDEDIVNYIAVPLEDWDEYGISKELASKGIKLLLKLYKLIGVKYSGSSIKGLYYPNRVNEAVEEVEVKTDREKIRVEQEGEETKVSVKPREDDFDESGETIIPVSNELKAEIMDNQETEDEEEVDIEEFDEESFDELEEKYLRKIYENVKSYKTVKGTVSGNKIKLEGLITFNSGNKKKTQFVFESNIKTRKGKLKFLGENLHFSTNKKAFTLTGGLKGKKLIPESFTYNYTARDAKTGKSQKLYGTIRK